MPSAVFVGPKGAGRARRRPRAAYRVKAVNSCFEQKLPIGCAAGGPRRTFAHGVPVLPTAQERLDEGAGNRPCDLPPADRIQNQLSNFRVAMRQIVAENAIPDYDLQLVEEPEDTENTGKRGRKSTKAKVVIRRRSKVAGQLAMD